jgi:hypothetical protein
MIAEIKRRKAERQGSEANKDKAIKEALIENLAAISLFRKELDLEIESIIFGTNNCMTEKWQTIG